LMTNAKKHASKGKMSGKKRAGSKAPLKMSNCVSGERYAEAEEYVRLYFRYHR
jgi:hypothetical protein